MARRLVADELLVPLTDDTAFTQETIMAKQDAFTPEEWTQLRLAPSLVAGGVAAADPSGIFASIKEAASGAQVFAEGAAAPVGVNVCEEADGRSRLLVTATIRCGDGTTAHWNDSRTFAASPR